MLEFSQGESSLSLGDVGSDGDSPPFSAGTSNRKSLIEGMIAVDAYCESLGFLPNEQVAIRTGHLCLRGAILTFDFTSETLGP